MAQNSNKQPNRTRSNPPKKRFPSNNNSIVESNKSINEFNSFVSQSFYSAYSSGFNIFDFYTENDIVNFIKDPMTYHEELRELSLQLYGSNGAYSNTVDYLTALHTLDRVIVTHGKNETKKQKNKELMNATLNTIKDKEFIRDALFRGMIEGIAFYYFESNERPQPYGKYLSDIDIYRISEINEIGLNASIISLPAEFTRIVGIKNSSYVIAFNLDFFTHYSEEDVQRKLLKYPKEIREAFEKRQKGKRKGNWVVLDNTHTIVHKIKSKRDEPFGRPLILPAIRDVLYENEFIKTKKNVLDEMNNRIIYQTFPEGKEKGLSSLTKPQQESQHNNVKSAVLNKNNVGGISFFSVASGTKINQIECANTDIFDDKYESNLSDKIALGLGVAASLLNGVGSGSYSAQQTNLELISAQLFEWVDNISAELNKCISANIIKDSRNGVECKYLPITYVNRSSMVGYMKDLYLQAGGSMSAYIAACGISPEVYYALLDEEIALGLEEKYPPHQTSYTLSNKNTNNTGGRPETDNPTDNTVASRSNNGNAIPTPSDK